MTRLRPLVYIHQDGCGKPSFLYRERPKTGDTIQSALAMHLDTRPIDVPHGSPIICESCGEQLGLMRAEWLKPYERRQHERSPNPDDNRPDPAVPGSDKGPTDPGN